MGNRLRVAMKSLECGARIWGAANKSNIHNMGEFEQKLLQECWNNSRRREYRTSVLGKRYNTEGAVSMTEFLATNYLKAKYIEPVMTEKEIVEEIRNLFPVNIKNALISDRTDTFEIASELLQMIRHDKPMQKPVFQSSYQPRGGSSESLERGQGNYQSRNRPYQWGGPSNFVPRGRGVNLLRFEGEQSYRGGYISRYRRINYR
jgi:phosphoribosyl-AMP cyclohydrolase